MTIKVEQLRAPQEIMIGGYQKRYDEWKTASGLNKENRGRLIFKVREEMVELKETIVAFNKKDDRKNKRLLAGEAADVFNFAMSILTVEGVMPAKMTILGATVETFDQLQQITSKVNGKPVEDMYSEMEEDYHSLAKIPENDSAAEVIELATKLMLRSGAMINKMGFDIYPVVVAKLQRNQFKYNPDKINYLVQEFGYSIDEAQAICKEDWENQSSLYGLNKHVLDDLFLIAQLEDSDKLQRALHKIMPYTFEFLESLLLWGHLDRGIVTSLRNNDSS